jgi:uncharacterized protein (TIGR02246 family)
MAELERGNETATGPDGHSSAADGIGLLLARFSDAVDGRRPDEVARLFVPDGLFRPGETPIRGQKVIEKFYTERLRDPLRRTRHVWANVRISLSDPCTATVTAVLTNYAYDPSVSRTELQQRIGNVTAVCVRDAGSSWRFREHLYERIFAVMLALADAPATNTVK